MGYLKDLGTDALATAQSKGFMQPDEPTPRQIALMHSELSEALEADRNNQYTSVAVDVLGGVLNIPDEEYIEWYERNVKGNFEEEMADLQIRAVQFSRFKNIDLDVHVEAKMRYNKLRPFKHGGKKY